MANRSSVIDCYVGLGSNLDQPVQQIEQALTELNHLPNTDCVAVSSLYHSQPMGPADQPDYVNAVARLNTTYSALELLQQLLKLENSHGRQRQPQQQNGPRTLDLDLLIYGDQCIDEPGLTVPHPGLHRRDFVLLPMLEISPDVDVPGLGKLSVWREKSVNHGAQRGDAPRWQ
ncbi:MAG: 2-amino-4-hydroxy-6-hydroxymethyldihydropteridine diphosphokinase [Immundisolibacteraceae bacterium]|nr:2-amino-4-hydroxy-6-hydroxymethyldihydropteridine diphosphokinase [Immundisolibacteraceae bacterium]